MHTPARPARIPPIIEPTPSVNSAPSVTNALVASARTMNWGAKKKNTGSKNKTPSSKDYIKKKRFETAIGENGTKVGRVVTTTYNKKTGKQLKSDYTDWFGVPTKITPDTIYTNKFP